MREITVRFSICATVVLLGLTVAKPPFETDDIFVDALSGRVNKAEGDYDKSSSSHVTGDEYRDYNDDTTNEISDDTANNHAYNRAIDTATDTANYSTDHKRDCHCVCRQVVTVQPAQCPQDNADSLTPHLYNLTDILISRLRDMDERVGSTECKHKRNV